MGLAQYSKNAGRLLFCDAVVGAMRKQELRTLQLCGFGRRQFVRSDRGRSACRIINDFDSTLSNVDGISN